VGAGTSSSALHRGLLVFAPLISGLLRAFLVGRGERLWPRLFERGDVRKSVISGAVNVADRSGRWGWSLTHTQRIDRLGHRSISEQVEISGSVEGAE
jgi:hypothetical protein